MTTNYEIILEKAKCKLDTLTYDLFYRRIAPDEFMAKSNKYQNIIYSCQKKLGIVLEENLEIPDTEGDEKLMLIADPIEEDILDCRRRVYGKRVFYEHDDSEEDMDILDYRKRLYGKRKT